MSGHLKGMLRAAMYMRACAGHANWLSQPSQPLHQQEGPEACPLLCRETAALQFSGTGSSSSSQNRCSTFSTARYSLLVSCPARLIIRHLDHPAGCLRGASL